MAKLINGHLRGSIGDLTYRKTKHGTIVSRKVGSNKDHFNNSPTMENARHNATEFTYSARAASVIRSSLHGFLHIYETEGHNRLLRLIHKALKYDTIHRPGARILTPEAARNLVGFELSDKSHLCDHLKFAFDFHHFVEYGTASVLVESFHTGWFMNAPSGATHFHLKLISINIDLNEPKAVSTCDTSQMVPLGGETGDIILEETELLEDKSQIFALALEYFQRVNGTYYPVARAHPPCRIIHTHIL